MNYQNPIIRGFNPDPSICRVGGNYYLVTSSFEYFPGIPVYHSADLVNWEQIGNCVTRADQLPMDRAQASGGIWAPTIRFQDGMFYVTASFSGVGNFIIHAEDPAGEWSDPVWAEMDGIDPSMFFEDGRMYYCANDCGSRQRGTEGISLAVMDVNTGKVISGIKRIWEGTGGGFLEAPHIYHIGDWYYLIAAEGGTRFSHMATLARSRDIWGPYEGCPHNPVLTNRNDTSKQALCCGHADLVVDEHDGLWFVHLGTRPTVDFLSHLGRETFLTPAVFSDGWIRAADGGKARIDIGRPGETGQVLPVSLNFDFIGKEWEKPWLFLRQPDRRNYCRTGESLILRPSTVKITDKVNSPTFLAVRQMDFECETDISFAFDTRQIGDEAGAVIYLSPDFMYRIFKRRETDGNYMIVKKIADDFIQTAYRERIADGIVQIKIKADRFHYEFYYTVNDRNTYFACKASTRFLTCELAGKCFTGTVTGIYAQTQKSTDAVAEFYSFRQYRTGEKEE